MIFKNPKTYNGGGKATRTRQITAALRGVAAVAILPVALGACVTGESARGYIFDQELADAIQPGVDNKQSVFDTLGSPTLPGAYGEEKWYYISTLVKTRPVFWPKASRHRVMAVAFDEKGVVSAVDNYGLDDRREIIPVGDKTPTRGRNVNLFQQLFSNIGRFGGGQPQQPGQQGPRRTPNG